MRRALGRSAGRHRAGARHRPGAGIDRHPACHRLHLVQRRLWHRCGRRIQRAALRRGHGRQRAQAADARPRRGCADADHPAGRARRHGDRGHPRHVRRCHAAGARLSDFHGLGGDRKQGKRSSGGGAAGRNLMREPDRMPSESPTPRVPVPAAAP